MKFFYNGYNFKVVTNKKLKSYFEIFQNISGVKSVFTIYGRPSQHKINACWTCFYLESKLYGYAGRILTHNTNMFTYGFVFYYINKKYFMVITKNNINSDTFEVLDITKE